MGLCPSESTNSRSNRLTQPYSRRRGYPVANRNGLVLANLFHADWALALAMALTGRRLAAFDGTLAEEDHEDDNGRPMHSPPRLRVVLATSNRMSELG